jgi:AcrR family transcriptional regulator
MRSGRESLLEAARTLLAAHPEREPTTRELYEAAGVTAPTLYHHFGDKTGLIEAVVEEAFAAYLERKRAVPRTGDWVTDFGAGWDMHITFGVENPVLYAVMYGRAGGRRSRAAEAAAAELRRGLEQLAGAGLLGLDVDEALAVTTAMAVGCVTQLIQSGGSATGPVARTMRTALLAQLVGVQSGRDDARQAVQPALARLSSATGLFTAAEEALLRQWLGSLAEHREPVPGGAGGASPTFREVARRKERGDDQHRQ